jgi:hypothetical protein
VFRESNRVWLVFVSLVLAVLGFTVACSHPSPGNGESGGARKAIPEISLVENSASSYASGTTQAVVFSVTNLDESKGVSVSTGNGCEVSSAAERVAGSASYRIVVKIPPHADDGICSLRVTSAANRAIASAPIHYSADKNYWKNTAPAMYSFANSRIWMFHNGSEVKTFRLLEVTPEPGDKLGVLLAGSNNEKAGVSLTPPNGIMSEFGDCVVEGVISGKTATLKPTMPTDNCKSVGTVMLTVSN